jgi:large subunit ribosomal protein L25
MSEIVVNAEVRTNTKSHAKYAMKEGKIPGVYYARGEENIVLQMQSKVLDKLVFTSETHVIDLRFPDGAARKAILKDVQFDPISDKPIHFDLQGLKENEKLSIEIPIVLTGGIPKGVRDGGMLQHFIHKLKISCLPKDIPSKVEIDVAAMDINDFIHVRDLNLPNVTIVEALESAIVGCMPPNVTKEAEPTAEEVAATAAAAAEPEVVGKGKKGDEGEAAPDEKEKKGKS